MFDKGEKEEQNLIKNFIVMLLSPPNIVCNFIGKRKAICWCFEIYKGGEGRESEIKIAKNDKNWDKNWDKKEVKNSRKIK